MHAAVQDRWMYRRESVAECYRGHERKRPGDVSGCSARALHDVGEPCKAQEVIARFRSVASACGAVVCKMGSGMKSEHSDYATWDTDREMAPSRRFMERYGWSSIHCL